MTKGISRELQEQLDDLYHLSPVLWAVVKGFDTEARVIDRLGRGSDKRIIHTRHAISAAVDLGMLQRQDDRLLLNNDRLIKLATAYQPWHRRK